MDRVVATPFSEDCICLSPKGAIGVTAQRNWLNPPDPAEIDRYHLVVKSVIMAFIRHFHPTYNFVYTQCTGMMDDNDLRIHILSFQVESKGLAFVREVLDFRHLQKADKLTVQGLIEITELERQRSEDRDFCLAIIANQPLFVQIAQIYAQIISTKNLRTNIFHEDMDGALSWLGYEDPRKDRLKHFIQKHRI